MALRSASTFCLLKFEVKYTQIKRTIFTHNQKDEHTIVGIRSLFAAFGRVAASVGGGRVWYRAHTGLYSTTIHLKMSQYVFIWIDFRLEALHKRFVSLDILGKFFYSPAPFEDVKGVFQRLESAGSSRMRPLWFLPKTRWNFLHQTHGKFVAG